jgi:hypothetical protein
MRKLFFRFFMKNYAAFSANTTLPLYQPHPPHTTCGAFGLEQFEHVAKLFGFLA